MARPCIDGFAQCVEKGYQLGAYRTMQLVKILYAFNSSNVEITQGQSALR